MEKQKTSNSQSNLEKEEWNWRNQPAWLRALLQRHSHQDSMVLAQRQKYRSMEQNKKPRDKSTHLWTPYLWQSEVAQSCPTLCDPMDCSLPGSSVHGIFQAIVLTWIAISFSRGSSQCRDRTWVSRIVDRRFPVWATREALSLTKEARVYNGEKTISLKSGVGKTCQPLVKEWN